MKLRKTIILGLLVLSLFSFVGCSKNDDKYEGLTKVVFELEGGTYQNCTTPIPHYYNFNIGTKNLIKELTEVSITADSSKQKEELTRAGYNFAGWYAEKRVDGDEITYLNRWNFLTDRVDETGITLYAYWKKNVNYLYNVCYYDGNNALKVLGSYNANQGERFDDYLGYSKNRVGYSLLGFFR